MGGIRGLPNVPDWLAFALEWAYVIILAVFIPIAFFCIPPLLVLSSGGGSPGTSISSRSTHHVKPNEKSRLAPGNRRLAAALAPAASQAPDPKKALAQEQLALTRQALSDLDRLYKGGEVASYDPRFAVWERRQVEAIRDAGASRAEFIAALEGYVKRLRDRQRIVEEAYRRGQVPRVDVYDAKYRVLEAEMWLNQEKAR